MCVVLLRSVSMMINRQGECKVASKGQMGQRRSRAHPSVLRGKRKCTHEAVCQCDDVVMTDSLEDVDLALKVV